YDTLNEIGAWPWARAKLARIIDEVSRARPKVIGMDMYFPDPQDDGSLKHEDGTVEAIPNDELFAESLKRAGNVLIPISVDFQSTAAPDRLMMAMEQMLENDLELEPDQMTSGLAASGFDRDDLPLLVRSKLSKARQEAMMARLLGAAQAGETNLDALRQKLTPGAEAAKINTDSSQLLEATFPKA